MPKGKGADLAEFLTAYIADKLSDWQRQLSPTQVRDIAIDRLLSPWQNPFGFVNEASARMDRVSDEIRNQVAAGKLAHWVMPRFAALLFEASFEACVAFWLARGRPKDPKTRALKPEVRAFIDLQVKLFTTIIGHPYPRLRG